MLIERVKSVYRRCEITLAVLQAKMAGRLNWSLVATISLYSLLCYWQMQDKWLYTPPSDVLIKLQALGFGFWLIYKRTRYVAFFQDDYLHVIQLPFKTILRLDEIQRIWFGNNELRIQMNDGTELNRYYLFSVYPRMVKDYKLQRLLVMR